MKSFSNPHGFIYSLKRDYFTFIVENHVFTIDYFIWIFDPALLIMKLCLFVYVYSLRTGILLAYDVCQQSSVAVFKLGPVYFFKQLFVIHRFFFGQFGRR